MASISPCTPLISSWRPSGCLGEHDVRARLRETERYCPASALRRTCHDGDLVLQSEIRIVCAHLRQPSNGAADVETGNCVNFARGDARNTTACVTSSGCRNP